MSAGVTKSGRGGMTVLEYRVLYRTAVMVV